MGIIKVRNKVVRDFGKDPFEDPVSWELLEEKLPENLWELLVDRAGAARLSQELPRAFPVEGFERDSRAHDCWEKVGNFYKNLGLPFEALPIYDALYGQCLEAQQISRSHFNKATPLIWMSDCYSQLNFPVLAKRYLMLAHCEDSIVKKGDISPGGSGVYFRLVWSFGLPDADLRKYAQEMYRLWKKNQKHNQEDTLFPEWILQDLDQDWMTEFPSPKEAAAYAANRRYIDHLLGQLGESTGRVLERLAEYVLSCMPGCKTKRRQLTDSGDHDIICSMEGFEVDFRSELGRYFVCECKDWDKPADVTAIKKFSTTLDSINSRFGIMFSKGHISGKDKDRHAERELLNKFQRDAKVIVVVDEQNLRDVARGANFTSLLRKKYERVRLNLKESG